MSVATQEKEKEVREAHIKDEDVIVIAVVEREEIIVIDKIAAIEVVAEKDDGTVKKKEVKLDFLEFSEEEVELKFHIVKVNKELVQVNSKRDYEVSYWCMDRYFHVEVVEVVNLWWERRGE